MKLEDNLLEQTGTSEFHLPPSIHEITFDFLSVPGSTTKSSRQVTSASMVPVMNLASAPRPVEGSEHASHGAHSCETALHEPPLRVDVNNVLLHLEMKNDEPNSK